MIRRPISVTVISCIQIATGILSLLGITIRFVRDGSIAYEVIADSPVPVPIQYLMSFVGMAVLVVCGYFMLKGKNWARWLCVGWGVVGLLFSVTTSPMTWMLVPGTIYLIIVAYFLFRPDANQFFATGGVGADIQVMTSWRSFLSVCFYLMSGFAFGISCMMAFFSYSEQAAIGKLFVLMVFVLPAAILLSIGRILSANPNWKHEVGIVLVVSAAFGSWLALSLALMFVDPAFRNRFPPEKLDFLSDYLMGGLWIAGMLLLGTLLLRVARREASTPRVHAPIPRFKRR